MDRGHKFLDANLFIYLRPILIGLSASPILLAAIYTSYFTYVIVQIMRFFTNPRKPMILALARPDPKKNLTTLVKAFGECRPLRELANLVSLTTGRSFCYG